MDAELIRSTVPGEAVASRLGFSRHPEAGPELRSFSV
ncbi:hypothetical protein RAM_32965 [Amycolatopsis mediterranei S699]|uniref:Uncharacterized protein n=1 Tax=Amycolatopsis mediterranei (strain S699) TaxID=713604 RepID=A0A9R0P2M1_AMYMS|nr:hypothetical protein RAM_32965 [Amycolatopsis mediterranei S699]